MTPGATQMGVAARQSNQTLGREVTAADNDPDNWVLIQRAQRRTAVDYAAARASDNHLPPDAYRCTPPGHAPTSGRVRARIRFQRRVGSPPKLPCIQRQLPAITVRNSPRSARGVVRACNRWRATGRAGRPRRDRSSPRGAPVRRRRPQCHGHAGSPRPRRQPDWLWRSGLCRPQAPP